MTHKKYKKTIVLVWHKIHNFSGSLKTLLKKDMKLTKKTLGEKQQKFINN